MHKPRLCKPSRNFARHLRTHGHKISTPVLETPRFKCALCHRTQAENQWGRHFRRHHRRLSTPSRNLIEQPVQPNDALNTQNISDDEDEKYGKEMQTACEAAAARARLQIENRIEELKTAQLHDLQTSRISMELPKYYEEVIKHVQHGYPIKPRQYMRRMRARPDATIKSLQEELQHNYIVTKSNERAREVLAYGIPLIPMVVRDASRNKKTFEDFLNHLGTQDCVEAHFLNDKYDANAEYTAPRKETGSNMAAFLRDGRRTRSQLPEQEYRSFLMGAVI